MTALYAHRGAKRVAPENTLPAFAAALEMGADGIELDVRLSRDGSLVVIHDATLERTTNGRGPVNQQTADALKALDAGSHFGAQFARVGVPTLAEVLDLVDGRGVVNIEIKSADPQAGAEVEPLLALLRQRGEADRIIISSFNPITLMRLRTLAPRLALGLLHAAPLVADLRARFMNELIRPDALHPHYTLVDEAYMGWARAHACPVNVWTVNDAAEARRLAGLGVAAIITDAPDVMQAALRPPVNAEG